VIGRWPAESGHAWGLALAAGKPLVMLVPVFSMKGQGVLPCQHDPQVSD